MALLDAIRRMGVNPEDDQAQQPMTMAPAAPEGMAASTVQHPMHAMVAPIVGKPEPPPDSIGMSAGDEAQIEGQQMSAAPTSKQPKVRTMAPMERQEDNINQKLMADYHKDQDPWGSADNHPGFLGKLGHFGSQMLANAHHVGGELTPRENEEKRLGAEQQGLEKQQSEQALQSAQTEGAQAQVPLREAQSEQALGRAAQAEGANDTKEDIATQHNKTLEDIASMHQVTQRAFQHVAGSSGGKDLFANYDPSKGVFTDLNGNALTDFKPKDKAMQGAYGAYGPMRLAGQLLNYASNDNPALLHVLAPVISHMIAGAPGGGNAAEMQSILSQAPASQPQDESGNPIGLRMPGAPTGATRSRGQFAESVLPSIADAETQIKQLGDKLGPMSGRFSELYNGKIGAYGPEYSGLQTTLHNIGTAWMRLHANSESARQDFLNALSSAKNPANLIANLHSIDSQARDYVQQGKGRGGQGPAQSGGQPPDPNPNNVKPGYRRMYVEGHGWGSVPNG